LVFWLMRASLERSQCSRSSVIGRLLILGDDAAVVGVATADVLLDGVEVGDPFECFGGNRCWPRGSEFIEAAAGASSSTAASSPPELRADR
jgi:hypothetical protein